MSLFYHPYFLLVSSFFFFSTTTAHAAIYAQDNTTPGIVISAAKLPQPKDKVGSAVTVINRAQLEKSGASQVYDVLKSVPGLTLTRNGGAGSTSLVRLRGSSPGQVRVMIDGIYVNDPGNANAEFDFNNLLVNDIERIEVLRGPQSALYGSNAMGGVINIITRRGEGEPQYTGLLEAGSFDTYRQAVGVSGSEGRVNYSAQAQNFTTQGFSRISAGTEKDGSRNQSINTRVGVDATKNLALEFAGGYSHLRADFDPSPTTDGPAELDKTMLNGKATVTLQTFSGQWEHVLGIQGASTDRDFDEPLRTPRYSTFNGDVISAEYQSNIHMRVNDIVTLAASAEEQSTYNSNTTTGGVKTVSIDRTIQNNAVYGQYLFEVMDNTTLTAGARHDDHELFGGHNTYRLTASHRLPEIGTTLRGSVGTGFKAPSLFQLYSSFGTLTLNPEEMQGVDIGIDQRLLDNRLQLSITGFYNDYDNLISFDTGTSRYINVDQATTRGVESSASYALTSDWQLHATHTYLLSEDSATHRTLDRRPKHDLTVGTSYDVPGVWQVGLDVRYVSQQWDSGSGNRIIKPYATVDAYGSYDMTPDVALYTRLENLFDRGYAETARYNAPGFAAYVGIRASY